MAISSVQFLGVDDDPANKVTLLSGAGGVTVVAYGGAIMLGGAGLSQSNGFYLTPGETYSRNVALTETLFACAAANQAADIYVLRGGAI